MDLGAHALTVDAAPPGYSVAKFSVPLGEVRVDRNGEVQLSGLTAEEGALIVYMLLRAAPHALGSNDYQLFLRCPPWSVGILIDGTLVADDLPEAALPFWTALAGLYARTAAR